MTSWYFKKYILKLKSKKMIGDFAIRLNELRGLAVEQMKHTESNGPGPAILLGVSLFFVIYRRLKGAQIIKL